MFANAICSFNDIFIKVSSLGTREEKSYPKDIHNFISYMEEAREAAEIAKNETVRDISGTVGYQKSGSHVQDTMPLNDISEECDNEIYASCHHFLIVSIGRYIDKVNIYNKKVRHDHTIDVSKWVDTTKSICGPKHKAGKSIAQ